MRRPRRGIATDRELPLAESADPPAEADDITAVRFIVGDVDADAPLLSDDEITKALEAADDDRDAAAIACLESLSRRLSLQADVSTGDLKLTYNWQSEALAKRAEELRTRVQGAAGAPFAGGISRADKEARRGNADRVQGSFRRGQFDDRRNF